MRRKESQAAARKKPLQCSTKFEVWWISTDAEVQQSEVKGDQENDGEKESEGKKEKRILCPMAHRCSERHGLPFSHWKKKTIKLEQKKKEEKERTTREGWWIITASIWNEREKTKVPSATLASFPTTKKDGLWWIWPAGSLKREKERGRGREGGERRKELEKEESKRRNETLAKLDKKKVDKKPNQRSGYECLLKREGISGNGLSQKNRTRNQKI